MLSIENPGALIAAIPAWLGYVPRRSVVLISLSHTDTADDRLQANRVTRVDLYLPDGSIDKHAVAMAAFADCAYDRPDLLCAVVIDDTLDTAAPVARYQDLIVLLRDRAAVWQVPVLDAWATTAVEPGRDWWSLLYPDDHDTQTSSATPVPGLIAPDSDRATRTAVLLADRLRDTTTHTADVGDDRSWYQDRMRFVLDLVRGVAAERWPRPDEIVELALLLRDPVILSCCCALADSRHDSAAQQLWTIAWETLPPGHRADAALLVALAAIVADNDALAAAAVRSILLEDADNQAAHRLSFTATGSQPIRYALAAIHAGHAIATDLGITLD